MSCRLFAGIVLVGMISSVGLYSQASNLPSSDRSEVKITLVVIGPGRELYLKWGHIGIIVDTPGEDRSLLYDYGLFSFEEENFFRNFAMGRLIYQLGVSPMEFTIGRAVEKGREVTLLSLNLPQGEALKLGNTLQDSTLPENRYYLYHHYWNNCATKVRDLLDRALGGRLREVMGSPAKLNLRGHTRRHLKELPFFDWLLPFLMGRVLDDEITRWDELFLPSEFLEVLPNFTYIDGDGNRVPLVSEVVHYNRATKTPLAPDKPSPLFPWTLLIGAVVAAVVAYGRWGYYRHRRSSVIGVINIGTGLFFGIAGGALFFLSLFTDHDVTYNNVNLLFINPVLLAAVPLGAMVVAGKRVELSVSILRWLWTILATIALLIGIAAITGISVQRNGVTLLLFLPPALAMSNFPGWISAILARFHRLRSSRPNR